ncbi:hypothetical protein C0039_11530 [Pseudohalioglobus lutimaris]|uniref:Autotransporter domain-containing protein n=1 Tax=Pseudohalioglobus lutimaris TaxID=1737061 RepID=A0A2N5X2D3_9GAMM|nr:hypothetical protein C0039_11530 [Pseudohalioglobus lutimaris]
MTIAAHSQAQTQTQDTTLGSVVAGADNSTDLQVGTGNVVQLTCGQMLDKYRPVAGDIRPAETAEEDLFFRCNEMVTTANALANNDGPTGNNLGWSSGQLAEAMQQLTGEEQVSKGSLASETSNGQFANIGMRLDAIRAGARSTAGGVNLAMNGTPVVGGNAGEEGDGLGWGWFLNGAYGFGERDGTQVEDEYDYDSYGATLGFDYMFDSGLVAGVAAGYADYEVDFDNSRSSLAGNSLTSTVSGGGFELDGYSLSAYLIGNLGRFYVDGLVSYGSNDYETERVVRYQGAADGSGRGQNLDIDRTMSGKTDSDTLGLGLSTGTTFELGGFDLGVDLGLSYLDITVDGYTEKDSAVNGGLNLAYGDQDIESLVSTLGAQLTRSFSTSSGVLVPYARADWHHEFKNDARMVDARYASQEVGQSFNLNVGSDDPDTDYFSVGLGVAAVFANNIQAFVDYRTTLGLEDVSANLFTIGVRGSF